MFFPDAVVLLTVSSMSDRKNIIYDIPCILFVMYKCLDRRCCDKTVVIKLRVHDIHVSLSSFATRQMIIIYKSVASVQMHVSSLR